MCGGGLARRLDAGRHLAFEGRHGLEAAPELGGQRVGGVAALEQAGEPLERLDLGGRERDRLAVAPEGAVEVALELEGPAEPDAGVGRAALGEGVAEGELGLMQLAALEVEVAQGDLDARVAGRELGGRLERGQGACLGAVAGRGPREVEAHARGAWARRGRALEEAHGAGRIARFEREPATDLERRRRLLRPRPAPRVVPEPALEQELGDRLVDRVGIREPAETELGEADHAAPLVGVVGGHEEIRLAARGGEHVVDRLSAAAGAGLRHGPRQTIGGLVRGERHGRVEGRDGRGHLALTERCHGEPVLGLGQRGRGADGLLEPGPARGHAAPAQVRDAERGQHLGRAARFGHGLEPGPGPVEVADHRPPGPVEQRGPGPAAGLGPGRRGREQHHRRRQHGHAPALYSFRASPYHHLGARSEPGMDFPRDFGPYRLLKQIAVGGMAEIVLAKTKGSFGFEKLLALKMIHPKFSMDEHFINMLIEEAKICVELDHVNIGQVFDLGRLGDTYFISMEYIEGADIFKIMRRATEIGYDVPIETCAHIGHEVCVGLEYAHTRRDSEGRPLGIIHRDMSPQNVLVSYAGEVKIVDFGIAKAGLRAKQTEVGVIKGKYYYMSPEQAWGDPVDHRSDIFSTGIIIYEMLTGQMLYLEDNIEILLDRVRKANIAPPSTIRREIPAELDQIVMRALAKRPEDRFQSAQQMAQALGSFLYSTSPDYTSARLASMLAWLFDEYGHQEKVVAAAKEQDSSLLLTRNDISRQQKKATGSLLYEFKNLVDLMEPSKAEAQEDPSDLDHTSKVVLSDIMAEMTASIDIDADPTDKPRRGFARPGQSLFATHDTDDSDGEWGEEATFIEPADALLRRISEDMQIQPGPQPQKGRQPEDVTRRIDTSDIAPVPEPAAVRSQKNSSYLPPPPPAAASGRPSQPAPAVYRPPPAVSGRAGPRRSEPPRPPPGPKPPPLPEPPPRHAAQPQRSSRPSYVPPVPPVASARPPMPPPRASAPPPRPDLSPFAREPAPGRSSRPPPPAPPGPPRDPASESLDTSGQTPTLDQPMAPRARDATGPTAMIPRELQLDPRSHERTGPTSVASLPDRGRDLIDLGAIGDETNPTVALPRRDLLDFASNPAPRPLFAEGAPAAHHTRELAPRPQERANQPPPQPQRPSQPPPPARPSQQPLPPQPKPRPSQPAQAAASIPPWLIGGDAFGQGHPTAPAETGRKPPSAFGPVLPDVEELEPRPESASKRLRKILLPTAIGAVVLLTFYFIWPRPVPLSTLDIRSHPAGAQVLLDSKLLPNRTPMKIEGLTQGGVHQVELRLKGYASWTQPVELNSPEVRQIAVLSPIQGTLRVTSEPSGASVIINEMYQGQTPHEIEGLDINREVQIQVQHEGQTQSQTLLWGGRTEATAHFTFEARQRRR